MEFGEIKSPDSRYIDDTHWPKYLRKLRTFPKGNKTCYKLQPVTLGSKYLIRPNFLYGNFDGLNSFPQFNLYLENTLAAVVSTSVSDWLEYDFIVKATKSYVTLCLCRRNEHDNPFISAIELRPMPDAVYPVVNATLALTKLERQNYGRRDLKWYRLSIFHHSGHSTMVIQVSNQTDTLRFPDDTLDRFWWSPGSNRLGSINTTQNLHSSAISESVSSTDNQYVPPSAVMQTAEIILGAKGGIQWSSTSLPQDADLFMCIYFAELKKLEPNETREFNITVDSKPWHGAFSPSYLSATTLCSTSTHRSQNNLVEYNPTERSTLSPIVNAMELYFVLHLSGSATDDADASSLVDIRDKYRITKAWTGDPCLPPNYKWEGLVCSNDTSSPRIISLDLSDNNLNGSVPDAILRKKETGSLTLSILGNKELCSSGVCDFPPGPKPKPSKGIVIGVSVSAGLDYLHSGCKPAIIHRDVKSANILLNDKLEAKIADFGLSKPVASEGVTHVRQSVLEGTHANIADPTLCGRYEVDSLRRVVDLALHCTSDKGTNRPKMCDVVTELKEAIRLCAGKQIQQESGNLASAFIVPR
ncbi:putative leucine-rich repeat receptor-like protein kinase [Nymphaea thermarum]|nr:putative leucine-rich repeat receptor-like protein kinase [Nymphaea thermarum]